MKEQEDRVQRSALLLVEAMACREPSQWERRRELVGAALNMLTCYVETADNCKVGLKFTYADGETREV